MSDMGSAPSTSAAKPVRQLKAVLIGAGNRGTVYSNYALDFPDRLKIVAIAEPRAARREHVAKQHGVDAKMCFASWEALAAMERVADFAIVTTPDRLHREPAVAFVNKGYHLLLEKPMAVDESDCSSIAEACERNGTIMAVCHVLRYTPVNRRIKQLIETGEIGDLISVQHTEPVGFFHFAHSYVRGNWHSEAKSTFSLMAKSCHDVDLIRWWMGGEDNPCTAVSSFGNLKHFNKESKPKEAGAATRCLDCAYETKCPYSAKRIYLDPLVKEFHRGWPVNVIVDSPVPDVENVTEALQKGPYGVCVYESPNDVVDHQVVNFQFSKGQTASFNMIAFTEALCQRSTRIFGSRGELYSPDGIRLEHYDFMTGERKVEYPAQDAPRTRLTGHDCADFWLMDTFVKAVASGDKSLIPTGPKDALDTHRLVFRAEEARRQKRVICPGDDAKEKN